MLQKIMEVSTGVYILWGLGVLGVLMKILANAYMSKWCEHRQIWERQNERSFAICAGNMKTKKALDCAEAMRRRMQKAL